jgi:hypothetical protein
MQLLVAEGTIVNAIVAGQAIVVAFVKTTLYAMQITVGTFRLAELDTGPKIYHRPIECPA